MTWTKDAASRRRDREVYGPAYRRARAIARRRANGRCEQCGHKHGRLEADHETGAANDPNHEHLRMLCKGPPCSCHDRKTAAEGGGWRKPSDPEPLRRTAW